MLLGNQAAARAISAAYPEHALLRLHPAPQPRRVQQAVDALALAGVEVRANSSADVHRSLERIKQEQADRPEVLELAIYKLTRGAAAWCSYTGSGSIMLVFFVVWRGVAVE